MTSLLRLNLIRAQQLCKIRSSSSTFYRAIKSNALQNVDRQALLNVYPYVVNTLLYEEDSKLDFVIQNFKETLEYNLQDGKKHRGLVAANIYKMLNDPILITKEQMHMVQVMGWCIEMLHEYFIIYDDIIDNSKIRRGKPTWFHKKDVKSAIIDGILLESAVYKLLKIQYKNQPYYRNILELFHEVTLQTAYGQSLDLLHSTKKDTKNFERCNLDAISTIADLKTGYYSFYLPTAAALYMSGINDSDTHEKLKEILLQLGRFYQVKNDFEDIFVPSDETGKLGSDIREGKCTWVLANALKKCDQQQLQLLKENYGHEDPASIQRVIQLFQELEIPKMYNEYVATMPSLISDVINQPTFKLPSSICKYLMKIFLEEKV